MVDTLHTAGVQRVRPSLPDPIFYMWLTPLSGDSPCGEDIGFSDEFESLRAEVEKGMSVHGRERTDWPLVLRVATQILGGRSKDLWVLCYGVMAAQEAQGIVCCTAALSALASLLESYWSELHPGISRVQRRVAPVKWLAARLESKFAAEVKAEEKGAVVILKNEVARLQAILNDRFGATAPSFDGLSRLLGDYEREGAGNSPSRPHRAEIAPPVLPPPPDTSLPDDDFLTAIDGHGRVPAAVLPRLLRSAQDQCRQLAAHFSSFDILDWRVVLLHRAALWCTVDQLPQADGAGVTQLRPVPPERAQSYAAAVEARRFLEVLPRLERSASKAPFWLDGHHLVARCLEGLDAFGSLAILRAVLAQFLRRFPELVRCKFLDGTPFASPRTAQWLDAIELPPSGQASPRLTIRSGEAVREQELLDESLAIRAERGFPAGLSHLERVPAGRSRAAVRQGLLLARYCIAAGNKKAAVRLLQSLYEQLEKWELLDWEPELSANIISLLLSLQPKDRGNGAETMLSRLHWLHLGTAVGSFKEV
ncbi:type VI secretion system protein TssA [Desulfomicrobium escambiense]|uniref:type VI secretion system protein TssA n=1 Tax=Desulfomicrobium escambiense TaxID=29503 RepID=UPI00041929B1|nr:type VI secretion system protein TssA [Desulfomicrobium escambiense]